MPAASSSRGLKVRTPAPPWGGAEVEAGGLPVPAGLDSLGWVGAALVMVLLEPVQTLVEAELMGVKTEELSGSGVS